jgi:wyosine [tRNA(Phe)-imidazoG37] synthetase (radical SAM superfamily)
MGTRHSHASDGQGIFKIALVLILGALSFLSHAWLRTKVVTTSFEVEKSRKARSRLENDFVELKAISESRLSATRLERLRERLADQGELFVEARPEQIVFLPETENVVLVTQEDVR